MSKKDAAEPVSRWDLPPVEGAPLPRAGAKGVNVMHLSIVEREGLIIACAALSSVISSSSPRTFFSRIDL